MEKGEKNEKEKIGNSGYINENCWLVKNLNYAPYKRCQHCESKFHSCLFLDYQIISLILIIFVFTLFFLIEGKISELLVITIFTLVIVYGYFFNKSTDRIIQSNFIERKAKDALKRLSGRLEEKVEEQTKEIRGAYKKIEKAYEVEKRAHRELKRLAEAKSQFMLSTQHHLRSPLSVMQGYLSMLDEGAYGKVNAKAKEKIEAALSETQKIIRVVDEILDAAKYQMNEYTVVRQTADIVSILRDVVADLQEEAKGKNLTVVYENQITLPQVAIDAKGIREAFYNIIDNAIKYTEKGGVTVKASLSKKNILISIADTGIGMEEVDRLGLFKRTFERGERAKAINTTGKGIGLYLAAQMVLANGGNIWVMSKGRGTGTTFYIELPIAGTEIAANPALNSVNNTANKTLNGNGIVKQPV